MALRLYRRHTADCSAGDRIVDGKKKRFYSIGTRTYESDEGKRGARRCACLIHAAGTLAGKFHRKCTNQFQWDRAKEVTAKWEVAGSWDKIDTPPEAAPVPLEEVKKEECVTVERAVDVFLEETKRQSAPNTYKKYRLLLGKLKKYSEEKGYISLNRWTTTDVREFRASWGVSLQTEGKNMSTIRAFFQFCADTPEWRLDSNAARVVKNAKGVKANSKKQRLPYTDDELTKMYEMCARWGKHQIRTHAKKKKGRVMGSEVCYREYNRKWTGQDLADFISVSTYTGLRICDVATFHISRMNDAGEIWIRAKKNDELVWTWVPEWLQERIKARSEEVGPFIFGTHTTTDINVITDVWRRKLKRLWKFCGPWATKPEPHRFRYTFVRILLEKGVPVKEVAELTGDTEEMIRKVYAPWVRERQERLTSVLKEAFAGKPKPNVVPVPKRTGTD